MRRTTSLFVGFLMAAWSHAAEFPAFLDSHCLECHDDLAKKGGLDLSSFTDEAAVMRDRAVWRSVYEKIESLYCKAIPQREARSRLKSALPLGRGV
jgi:hypothetical protein